MKKLLIALCAISLASASFIMQAESLKSSMTCSCTACGGDHQNEKEEKN